MKTLSFYAFRLSLIVVLLPFKTHGADQPNCLQKTFNETSPLTFKACIDQVDQNNKSKTVLYFLHGHGASEETWFKSKLRENLRSHWQQKSPKELPTVVTFSLGPKTNLAREDIILTTLNDFLPYIEAKVGFKVEKRLLAGMSLGGWNALALLLKKEDIFDRVALLCPAIMRINSWSKESEIRAYLRRTRANWFLVRFTLYKMKKFYKTLENYQKHDPYILAPLNLSADTPSLYISANKKDEYGFGEGAQDLANFAKENGVDLKWHLRQGRHCSFNTKDIAFFLIPPQEKKPLILTVDK